MEFIIMDLSLLLISFVVATIVLVFYTFSSTASYFNRHCVEAFAVIDVIRILKKICPIGFGNKWKLLSMSNGLSRCWSKRVQFPGFQNSGITLCGTTVAVNCSSVYAFSHLADVLKWGEWEPLPTLQCLLLKPFCDSQLQKDRFMQADQVVGIQRGTNVQSYLAMYRFMSFSKKTVKWILFWNATKLEFMFFLIQPAISKSVDDQCVITHIASSKQSSHLTSTVAQRLRNISDFLLLSQLHVVSSKYLPTRPSQLATKSKDHSQKDKQSTEVLPPSPSDSSYKQAFVLVPFSNRLNWLYEGLKGFQLVTKKLEESESKKQTKVSKQDSPIPHKEKIKKSVSEFQLKTQQPVELGNSSNSLRGKDKNKSKSNEDIRRNSIIIEEKVNIDVQTNKDVSAKEKLKSWSKERSVSEPVMSNISNQNSAIVSKLDKSDEETFVNLHVIHESISEDSCVVDGSDRNEMFCTSLSEVELVDSNQKYLDCKLADFLTQGNYCASELQAEMMLASHIDVCQSFEDQFAGGWSYHSTYKGISVLTKTTAGQFMKIVSFLCQLELPVAPVDVWKCVKNPRFRFISDETVKTVKIVERISESQRIIHVYRELNGLLMKESLDFCLLQTEREENNYLYSCFHSMEHDKCPFMTSVTRGSLRPSGWVVEKIGSKLCKVTHVMQIVVISPDCVYIQELCNLVPLAMHNLKNYISSKPHRF